MKMNGRQAAKWFYAILGCAVFFLISNPAQAGICPTVSLANDCGVQINVTGQSGGSATAYSINLGPLGNNNPYDGEEDTLIGITNMTGATLTSVTLMASASANAFGFDGDGACVTMGASAGFACGATGYEGPNMTFGAVTTNGNMQFMTVTFTNGLGAGMSTWFSLEGTPTSLTGANGLQGMNPAPPKGSLMPEPASLLLLASGFLAMGFMAYRRSA